ncbi:MAG TPA: AarF/UbiB family protein [Myxococcota bacterium]|nr:AarF/UbiB family protein [Myxococcota bacterium]
MSSSAPSAREPRALAHGPVADAWRATGIPQALRLLACVTAIGFDALRVRLAEWLRNEPEAARESRRARLRDRSARRVVATLGALKGVYVKLGQFAALRLDLLPREITDALASLRDAVPPLPFASVRRAIERELGGSLESHFAEFEETPLGAASIAQVHRARLRSGEAVAVKVQYPWLRASLPADLALVGTLFRLWPGGRTARRDRARLFAEFAAGLREELDFEREARVAAEIARNLAANPRIAVPEIVHSHTRARVLTMRYLPAVGLADRAGLARLGVAPREVLEIVVRAYAAQIFVDGLFHADPHPGNLFVIDEPGAAQAPRVLFVDFGLSRRLDPQLRRELRLGLYALLQRDVDAFVAGMGRMGMIAAGTEPAVSGAVAAMFERVANQGGALGMGGAAVLPLKDEAKALLQETPGLQLPNDLLLYAKTLSYVFALGADLAPEVDALKLSLPYALQFLAQDD